MKSGLPIATLLVLALAACSDERTTADDTSPPTPEQTAPSAPAAPPVFDDQPEEDVPPATAAETIGPLPAEGAIGFSGFGPARFGADEEAVRMAWGKELTGDRPDEPSGCYYLFPQTRPEPRPQGSFRIAFMIEGERFSRIDVDTPAITAPGGGKVGMSGDEIHALYRGRVDEQPHKYIEGGRYLRIAEESGGNGVLLFAVDADGVVTEWRIGVPPQVDYVEGCS